MTESKQQSTTESWISEIKARLERATPGPWETRSREFSNMEKIRNVWSNLGWVCKCELPAQYAVPDAELIANAPTDIENLLEALRVKDEALREAQETIHDEFCGSKGHHMLCSMLDPALAWTPSEKEGEAKS